MAIKRSAGSDPIASAGAAPARGKSRVSRKHKSIAAAELNENAPAVTPTANPVPSPAESAESDPTFEAIAQLAYSYWEARGYQGGSAEEDWLRAESELRSASSLQS